MPYLCTRNNFCYYVKFLFGFLLTLFTVSNALADTHVTGNQSGLWSKANSPYILDGGGITVPAGQTLLVEPGVEIRSTNYYDRVTINGTLIAQGTVADSIRFTNYSNNGLTYEGVLFFAAGNTNSIMDYVSMDSWGYNYYGDVSAVYIQDGEPVISHSTFNKCYNTAIFITSNAGAANISNSVISNTTNGIQMSGAAARPLVSGINFINNALGVYAYASQISGVTNCNNAVVTIKNNSIDSNSTFVKNTGNSYYNIEGGFSVAASKTLTIQPGVEIRSTNYYDRITINGTLVAQGTVTDSIRFTNYSNYGLAKEGALFFAAGNANSSMDYVSFDSWGYNYYGDNAAVYIQDGSPSITHSTIRNSNSRGIYITGNSGSATLANNHFTSNPVGIEASSATSAPIISGINFTNTPLGIYAFASQIGSITNCNNAVITIKNSSIDSNATFAKHTGTSYYNIEGGFTVAAAKTLTIQPGVEIKSTNYYDRITINGSLIAQGTVTDSIRFTNGSYYGLAQEGSLFFAAGNANCVMDYVSLDSWGYNYYGDNAAVYIQDGSPTISNSRFARCNNTAILINNGAASPNISNTNFVNTPTGINITNPSVKPILTGLDFTNTPLSVYTYASQMSRITNLNNAGIILRNSTIDTTCRFPKFTGNSYYNLEGGFTVAAATTLTIDPGVQVRSTNYYDRITVNGTLIARGTATDSIRFLNYTYYGLSQEGSLIFGAGNTNSVMDYVVMDRWGYNYNGDQSAVDIQSGTVPITNCSFTNSNSRAINCSGSGSFTVSNTDFVNNPTGIYISGSSAVPTISSINISGSNSAGINVVANGINPFITGVNFSNTPLSIYTFAANMPRISNLNTAVITLRGSTIDSACTLYRFPGSSHYNIEGEITLAASKTLTIQPGVEIRSTYYYDRLNISGTLIASGTATDSIKFLNYTNYGLSQEGALNFTTGNTNSVMDYVQMDGWGYNYLGDNAAVNVQDGEVDITHSTFKNSNNMAVKSGANGLFNAANTDFYNNPTAMYIGGSGGTPILSGINISNSSSSGINVAAASANPYISGATFSNTPLAVYTFASDMPRISNLSNASVTLKASTIDSTCTMPRFPGNSYYNIEGQIVLAPTTTLTIQPGVDIRSTYYYDKITINGTLKAQGTAADSIRFFNYSNYGLSREGALIFAAGNTNCVMDYVSMDKWGYNYVGDNVAVNIQSGDVAISHSTFKNSNNIAVLNSSATSNFSYLDIIDNPTGFYNTNGSPVLTTCSIFNNGYGVNNVSGTTADTVDARNCYWGTATGPYHPSLNPTGTGNQVSDRVKFIPWTAQPYIFSFAPTVAGNGDTVVITGDKLSGITSVTFGGVAAKSYTIVSDSIIIAIVDTGSSGFVAVTSPGGPASKDGFIFCTPITPTVLITSNKSDTICKNVAVTFTATITNGGTSPLFFWTRNGTPISGATTANYATDSLSNNDVIQCFLLSNEPCASLDTAASNTKTIRVNQPTFSITNDTICAGSTYTFNGNGYTTTGTYVAHLTNAAGCDSTATLNLYVKANSSSVTTASICPGDSVLFNGAYYKTQGVYPIHFTNTFGCDSIATLDLTVKATSSSTALATICNGDSYPFNGNNYTTGGTYTIHFTNSFGCDSAAILVLTVNPILTPSVTIQQSPASPVCTGTPITFSAVPANGGPSPTYQWKVNGVSVATSNPFITSSLQNNDTVTCTITSSETCVTTATANSNFIIVNIATTPVISIMASADSVCPGQIVTLTASGALTYSWAAANGLSATTGAIVNANPTAPTTYIVTGYNGCTSTATISIGIHDVPVANAGTDQSILRGSSGTLTATGGNTYVWNTGDTTASIVVSPTNTTDYIVAVANQSGCTDKDTVRVNVNFSSLTINNASHNYGDVVVNTPVAFTLQITNNGTLPINIDSALVNAPFSAGFTTQSLPAGNTLSIPVTFNPPATLIYQQNLLIKTAVGDYTINLRGRGVNPAPAWTVAPVAIDYGNVIVGSNSIRNFLVTNTGDVPVTLDSLIFANAVFTSSTSTPATIAVGGNKTVAVSFAPAAIASYSDNLKVKSNTNGLNTLQVAISGFGYVPGTPPQIKFVQAFPYNGTDGVNPPVGQPGLYTYRIIYKSATNTPPQNGYPKVGIDKSGDGDFIDPSEGVYAMTKVDSTTEWINGEAYTFSATLANGANYGYQFFAKDSLGNVATAINTAYQSGPVVTNQTLDLSIYANDITFSKQNPAVNETFTAFATVHNNTPYSASNVNIRFYTDSIYYGETTLPYIGPNGSAPVSLNLVYGTDGFYPIKVWIDSAGVLGETNALNNYAIRPITVGHFTVPGAINITATSSTQTCPNGVVIGGTAYYTGLNLAGTPPALGATVTVTVTDNSNSIVASGTTNTVTGGNWNIYFGGLNCGTVYRYTATVTDYTLTGSLSSTKTFVIPCVTCDGGGGGNIDLYSISNSTALPPCLINNQPFVYTINVANSGNKTLYNDTLKVYADGTLSYTYLVDSLIPSQVKSFGSTFTLPTGNHALSYNFAYRNATSVVNDSSSTVINVQSGLPDLYLTGFSQNNVGFVVQNVNGISCSNAAPSKVYIYDSIPNAPAYTLVDSLSSPALGNGNNVANLGYDFSSWSRGQHYLLLRTDGSNVVTETNENNNTLNAVITIKPDLYISLLEVSNSNVKPNDVINFTATVKNRSVNAGTFKIEFKVGNTVVGAKKVVSGLAYNNMVVVISDPYIVPSNCPDLLKVKADADDDVDELDETNNVDSILMGTDLISGAACYATGSSCNPYTVPVGGTIRLYTPVSNIGSRDADTVGVRFVLDTTVIGYESIPHLAPATSVSASVLQTFNTVGLHVIAVNADYDNKYCETNEGNNTGYIYVQVQNGLPDLRVLSQDISPSNLNPNPGQAVTIVSSVHNIGVVKSKPVLVRFEVDGVKLGNDVPIDTLYPGQDTTVAATATYTGNTVGPKIIKVWVDSLQTLAESTISNNAATRAIIVGNAPDFSHSINEAITFAPARFQKGNSIRICNFIRNYGGDNGSAFIKFYVATASGRQLIDSVLFTLNDHDSAKVCTNWVVSSDSGVIITQIGGSNPPEFNGLNNDDSISFKVSDSLILPVISTSGPVTFCVGGSVLLSSSSATGNQWFNNGNPISGATDQTYLATTGGTYSVLVTATCCASAPSSGMVVTVNSPSSSTTDLGICSSALPFTWNGLIFTGAGSRTYHTTNARGCDSAATLNLTIKANSTSLSNRQVCSSALPFSWNGLIFTGAGSQTAHLTNALGCDSAATLNLTVVSVINSEQTISRCGSYTWNGTSYSVSGDYNFRTTNATGCDSIATLHLFITNQDTLRQMVNTCKSYTWNGVTYRKSGVYYYRSNTGGCKLVAILTLTIPRLTSTVSVTQPLCRNSVNGGITVTATNGTAPYLYKNGLNGVYQPTGTFSGLFGATYRVYFQDANGCEGYTDSINLINPSFVTATAVVTPSCNNGSTGKITVSASGGNPTYLYKNGVNGTYQSSNVFSGLQAGVQYRIYVQDSKGCIGSTNLVTVTQSAITATGVGTDAPCFNTATGSFTVNAIGGVAPYKYKNGSSGAYQSSNVMTGLRGGVQYRFYVQDLNGCVGNTALITVGQAAALTSTTTTTPPVCIASPTGTATIVPSSGVPPYTYKYSSASAYQTSNTFTGLLGNTPFRLYFLDATGCVGNGDYTVLADATNPCTTRMGKATTGNPEVAKHLTISLAPNPSNNQFILIAHGASTQPVTLRVMDINGRTLHQAKGQAEQSFRFGASFAQGIYLVEVRQGEEVKTVKAVKIK